MRVKLFSLLIFLFLIACGSQEEEYVPPEKSPDEPEEEEILSHEKGKEIFDLINQYYSATPGGLMNESYPSRSDDPELSYLWPYVGYVDGSAMLAEVGYEIDYPLIVDNYEKYFSEGMYGNNLGAYSSSTNGTTGQGTRFYDDNAIVGLSLLEAYEITADEKYLERAEKIIPFIMGGEDEELGGGIWWNEDQLYNPGSDSDKGISSNGYPALFFLKFYTLADGYSQKAELLSTSKRLYEWVRTTFYDSGNHTYANSITADGNINHTRWTYNSGVMIQVGVELFKITGEQEYLDEAIAAAQGAYDYYVKPRNGMAISYPDHDPWFNTKLLDAYIDLAPYYNAAGGYIDSYLNFIDYGYEHARTSEGFFYEDWTGEDPKRYYSLLMQASVVESYGALSLFYEEEF
ncbi:glycoside hydrolase family 76 protein [Marinilabilia salmonicolor]|uniref:glycoside hydrolase family 76 protein n=1 Tax=Marinilabilia salmonicolor TaxID=989 RepID=UPI000299FE92|nr:glycoside hydrolase family 76 protein [Marinilabilia salmonicolor]